MSSGNYDYDNFVRVDCCLTPEEFETAAVHEVAHFSLTKQSSFGLLCFFLQQDTRDARSPLLPSLRVLEQACECVNECYARTKELLLCTPFPRCGAEERAAQLERLRGQAWYLRYRMALLEPILLSLERAARAPVFPDLLFLAAANPELQPLLALDLRSSGDVRALLLSRPELNPDLRFQRLTQSFQSLLGRMPPEEISAERLLEESGLTVMPYTAEATARFFAQMEEALSFSGTLRELFRLNRSRGPFPVPAFPAGESFAESFRLSLADCVIPYPLQRRFRRVESREPVFRPEKNVLHIALAPEALLAPALVGRTALPMGPRSALFRFYDTAAGELYDDCFAEDLAAFRRLFSLYPGTVWLYLEDYAGYLAGGEAYPAPVFFRCDLPWDALAQEYARCGVRLRRFFLQQFSDCAFFFFGFDSRGNVIFSLLAGREYPKLCRAVEEGRLRRCAAAPTVITVPSAGSNSAT